MALSPGLRARQTQQLTITPHLQQAMKLLQMTNAELGEFLETAIEGNPFLELQKPLPLRDNAGGSRFEGLDAAALIGAKPTLAEHLSAQIRQMPGEFGVLELAEAMAYELDDDGFFRLSLNEFAARNHASAKEAEAALRRLQACLPSGIGARNLAECLRLQLEDQDAFDPPLAALLAHLDQAGKGYTPRLGKLTGLSRAGFDAALARIRRLDPRPGRAFTAPDPGLRLADITVRADGKGGWRVELESSRLPQVLLNETYVAEIGAGDDAPARALKNLAQNAGWLKRTLDQRARTILRVAGAITERQQGFLASGPLALRPMTLADVAADLGLHVSTISRVVTGKHLECSHGIVALKALFSGALAGQEGQVAAASVRQKILSLVAREPPAAPLTDEAIAAALAGEGITVARRTVAKYRCTLRIPSAGRRLRQGAAPDLRRQTS